jgi:hypothetical protein
MTRTPFTLLLALAAGALSAVSPGPNMPDTVPICPSPQRIAPVQTVAGSSTSSRSNMAWNGRDFGMAYWSSDARLHFVRVYSDGTAASAPLTLTSRQTYAWAPSLVWNGSGYAVAWNERGPSGSFNQVYFARLNPDGTMIGVELKVSVAGAVETANALAQSLAWSGSGYAVVWEDYRNPTADIRVTLLDSVGAIAGPAGAYHDLPVSLAAFAQQYPAIAWSQGYGQYLAVWEDFRSNSKFELYRSLISTTGGMGGEFLTVSGALDSSSAALADTGNGLGLVWQDGSAEIYFARLSSDGLKIGANIRLTNDGSFSLYPRMVWTGGEFGVVWQDDRPGGGLFDIWYQRVSQAGAAVGGNIQVTYSGGTFYPDLAFGSKGYLITGSFSPGPVILQAWGCSADYTPPTCAGGYVAYSISGTNATLGWLPSDDPQSDIAYYNVYRNAALVGKTSSTYYNDSGLSLSTSYGYAVQPVNAWQLRNSACTDTLYLTTNASLTLTMNKSNPAAVLNWTDVGAGGYKIYRGNDPHVMGQIASSSTLTAQDANALGDGNSYFYSVDE